MTPLEWIVIALLSFGGGYYEGHKNVSVECAQDALITTNCPDPQPPADRTFGATTASYVELVTQYRKCKTACVQVKK